MCRHELRWLEVEATLFRQRAGRDEVQRLWKGVAEAAGPEKASPGGSSAKPLAQLAGLAVALMLVVAIGRWKPWQGTPVEDSLGDVLEEVLESQAPQSEASWSGMSSAVQAPCSRLPDDLGFVCGPVSADRLLASR